MTNTIKTHCISAAFAVLLAVSAFAVPAHAADAIFPTGSRVGLVPPGDMTPSKTFEGFADPQKSAAILISTLPAEAYGSLEKTGIPDALLKQGFTIDKREPIELKSGKGFLITGTEVADKTRFRKWLLVAALDDVTALISVQAPEDDATYSDKALRAVLPKYAVDGVIHEVVESEALIAFRPQPLQGD